jgi:hypothetical protein
LIAERSDATPNPAVEVRQSLPDGLEFKAAASPNWLRFTFSTGIDDADRR